ncbi:MAG: radical SAM protein, partial [Patescibacteria group bacterium]
MKIIEIKAKEIFTKTKLGADWVINPYVGCSHNCLYCYAKFIARWRPLEYGKWGDWVEAKINGPELVKDRKIKGEVFMSSICDAYQPVEKDLKLTRKILENLDKNVKLSILTKSDLVLRDVDIFKHFKNIEVGLTINSFTDKAKKLFEPNAIDSQLRINALKKLKEQGIKTYAFISPIIPGLINLQDIVNKTKSFVDYYWFEFLNLRG